MMRRLALIAALAMTPVAVQAEENPLPAVQANLDAYRAKDLDAFVRTFAPDAVVEFMGVQVQGHARIRAVYRANFAPSAPSVQLVDSGRDGNQVWMQYGLTFADGTEMCCAQSDYTVNGGKITYLVAHMPE